MNVKNGYNTKQKQLLLNYLQKNIDRQLSVQALSDALSKYDIGKSTVYRHIGNLCDEGVVRRFRGEDGKSVLYQYVGGEGCKNHFHLKCLNCGALVHLNCEHIEHLKSHIVEEHNFYIDTAQTVLYGLCEKCREGQA